MKLKLDENLAGSYSVLRALAVECLAMLDSSSIESGLWIIEPGRIRVHQRDDTR